MGNKSNIIVGAAVLKVNGVDCGYTQGGVVLRYSPEYFDVEADQLGGIAKKEKIMEKMFVSTTLLEATLKNLQQAMNQPSANLISGTQLTFGEAALSSTEFALTITGKGPDGLDRTYNFYRAVSSEEVEFGAGYRDQASVIPITWELLKDEAHNSTFGYMTEV